MISTIFLQSALPKSSFFSEKFNPTLLTAIHHHFFNQSPINPTQTQSKHPLEEKITNLVLNCTNLRQTQQIHAHIITTHFLESKNNGIPFHWNNIIRSYIRLSSPCYAFKVYLAMFRSGVSPDCYTLPIALKASGQLYAFRTSWQLHGVAVRNGLEGNVYVQSGLISMYVKAGDFWGAYKVFDESPERKLGSWNAVIAGFSQGGRPRDAIGMFVRMMRDGVRPDGVTMVSVNSACGSLGDFKLALQLHKYTLQVKFKRDEDVLMLNSVVDMYGKCGRMDLSHEVFSKIDQRNVSSWTSMIVGYAMHGHANEAMECFNAMTEANVMPNHVTFVGVLSACVHGGMVNEGKHWFQMMRNSYGIEPQMKHYGCMADLFGRAGLMEEARNLVEGMPMKPNVVIWGCLLGACERHSDVKMGEWVAKHFLELEPWNDGIYVVLSNIYASRDMWNKVEKIREVMKKRTLAKLQGYSLVTSID